MLESNILELLIERDALKSDDINTKKNDNNDNNNDNNNNDNNNDNDNNNNDNDNNNNDKNKEEKMNNLSDDESMIIFKDEETLHTQKTWIEIQINNDMKTSQNSQHIPTLTTYNNDNEIFILNEKLNTANYEIQVLQNKLEISNLILLSVQSSNYFKIEENNNNLIITAHSNIINENNCDGDGDGEGENLSYDINHLRQLNNNNETLQNDDNEDKSKNDDMSMIDNEDKMDKHVSDKYDSKHEHEKYFDNVLDHECENENKNEDEEFITSNNDQFNENKNISKEIDLFDITEPKNTIKNHYSNGKLKDISIKPSHEEHLNNDYVTSSSNNTIDIIESTQNFNFNLEKSKDFFFSEKILSMSKKLKILKEKLIDRRYWKKVALCVAEAAVLACAGATAIPTLDVIEKKNSSYNRNNNNNNGNNDDEFSPFLADNRITRHLSSSRYKGSILVNEELLRTVLVMSQVRYAMLCYDMV